VRVARKESSKSIDFSEMERIIKLVQERAEAKPGNNCYELGGKDVEVRLVNSALVILRLMGTLSQTDVFRVRK